MDLELMLDIELATKLGWARVKRDENMGGITGINPRTGCVERTPRPSQYGIDMYAAMKELIKLGYKFEISVAPSTIKIIDSSDPVVFYRVRCTKGNLSQEITSNDLLLSFANAAANVVVGFIDPEDPETSAIMYSQRLEAVNAAVNN